MSKNYSTVKEVRFAMTDRFKLNLSVMWLVSSLFALALPIFIPSYSTTGSFASNAVGTATATMFLLSFPSSLFGAPLLLIVGYALGVRSDSIEGMYVNLLLLFVLGLVQWFWIVPRVLNGAAPMEQLNIGASLPEPERLEPARRSENGFFDVKDDTPLERVLRESDAKKSEIQS